jgi:predicted Zn-dependent protease
MKITCKNCLREIDIAPFTAIDSEKKFSCDWCGIPFSIRQKVGYEGYDIVFEADKRAVRACVNCGKKFYAMATEAIPVCPTCKSSSSVAELATNMYCVIKESGKRLGPYTLEEMGSWIREGNFSENDIVEAPDKSKVKIFSLAELTPYLKEFYSKSKKPGRYKSDAEGPALLSFRISGKLFAVTICIVVAGIWIWQILKTADITINKDKPVRKATEEIVAALTGKFSFLPSSYDSYYQSGLESLKQYTHSSCIKAKDDFIKAYVKDRSKTEALPMIAFSLACIYRWDNQEKFLKQGIEIAQIAIDEMPASGLAYAAKAELIFKQGNQQEALKLIKKAKELLPENPLLEMIEGDITLGAGDIEKAAQEFAEATKIDPAISVGHMLLAEHAIKMYRFGTALKELDKRLIKTPKDSYSFFKRAEIQILRERYEAARNDLEKTLFIDYGDDKARILLASLLLKEFGQTDEAARNIAISLGRGDLVARTDKADALLIDSSILLSKKLYDKALSLIEEALAIKPADPYIKLNKANAMLGIKLKEKAAEIAQEFILGDSSYDPAINLYFAELFEKNGLKGESLDLYSKYTQSLPVYFYPFAKLAIESLKKNEIENAKRLLLEGMNKTSFYSFSDFTHSLKAPKLRIDYDGISKSLEKASSSLLNSDLVSTAKALLIYQGNEISHGSGNSDKAKNILDRVIRRDQSILHAYLILGLINLKAGKSKKALDLLRNSQDIDLNNIPAKISIGMALTSLGKPADARGKLEEALGTWEDKFFVLFQSGLTSLSLNKRQEAVDYFLVAYEKQKNYLPLINKFFQMENF